MQAITLIVSFLGGGVVGALLNWIRAERADKKERKIKFLNDQIRELYGPLYYFVSQTEKLFELDDRLKKAYIDKYENKDFSSDVKTQEAIEEQMSKTLNVTNEYMKKVIENNIRIKEIFDRNYSLMDPDDLDIFLTFYEHYIRYNVEIDSAGRTITPVKIYKQVGNISFLKSEFIDKVKTKFLEKKNALDLLIKN